MIINCRICGSIINSKVYKVREMYFGTKDEFEYQQCSNCDCLQIVDIPENLSRYYPEEYYCKNKEEFIRNDRILSKLKELRLNIALGKNNVIYNILFFLPKPRLPYWINYLNVNSKTKILDVGCALGKTLLRLRKKGFQFLQGIDPFINSPISYSCGIKIHKKQLWDLTQQIENLNSFDLIMMHHSLEHIPDQPRVFESSLTLLKKGGNLLIRIPVSSSWAWENYRENWVQLDPPRHLYLHSLKSIKLLGNKYGFKLDKLYFDSTEFQFTGSEKWLKKIPLVAKKDTELFSSEEIKSFKEKAKQLNIIRRGDQACFIFTKS